jgi:hypothetical protein
LAGKGRLELSGKQLLTTSVSTERLPLEPFCRRMRLAGNQTFSRQFTSSCPGNAMPLQDFSVTVLRADFQHPCCISHATAIGCHVVDLLFNFWQVAAIGVVPDKRAATTLGIATKVRLFACSRFPMSDHIYAVTIWAVNWLKNYRRTSS